MLHPNGFFRHNNKFKPQFQQIKDAQTPDGKTITALCLYMNHPGTG
jgi:hypothetical protein